MYHRHLKNYKSLDMKNLAKIASRIKIILFAIVILFFACNPAPKTERQSELSSEEARSIAKEAFLWGMHPVAIYHLRYNYSQNDLSPIKVGLNRIAWFRKPLKALPKVATTPNATTLYGTGMFDVSKEPMVIIVPDIKDHYWSVQLFDNYARWGHMIGSQFNAPGKVQRLILGPDWDGSLPEGFAGADVVQSKSNFVGVLARVALTDNTDAELKIVNGIQDGITAITLSQWNAAERKLVRAEDVPGTVADYPTYPGMETVKEPGKLAGVEFLRWVGLVLNDPSFTKQTDGHKEIEAFKRFERLGLKAGVSFDPDQFSPEIVTAIEEGIEEAKNDIQALSEKGVGFNKNGWDFTSDLDYKDTDWLTRARYGLIAVLAPVPSRSHTGSLCIKDSEGRLLTGEHNYTITFDLDNMPPVTEFWEMPLYDNAGYFVDNPLDRYSLNSYMLERGQLHTENGKLIIYVQKEEPTDPNKKKNWLPAPEEGFQFAARFYGAYTPLIDGAYDMPGVVRVD